MNVPTKLTGLLVCAILAASNLTGCAMQQKGYSQPAKAPTIAGQDISGEWQVVDSTARFKISLVEGQVQIEGWDSSTGEKFRISDAHWDGRRLRGIFVLPSMKRTTFSHLLLLDPNTLKGSHSGDSFGPEVWKRQAVSAPPATAGPDISGEWQAADSTARFKIAFVEGQIQIEGWDSSTGEKFRISDARWDGRRLQAIFVLPSMKRTTFSNFLLVDPTTLKGSHLGDSSGAQVWTRQAVSAPPAPTAPALQQKAETKPSEALAPATAGPDISGEWHVVNSTARFIISFADGAIRIEGWDSSDGERFRISEVHWDGKRLQGTFVMPSTNGTTYSSLVLLDANTLKGTYKGDSSGAEVWKRQ